MVNFKKLAQVQEKLEGRTPTVSIVDGRRVVTTDNPLNSIELRERISDSARKRVVIVDNEFLKALKVCDREKRRGFLALLSAPQRSKIIDQLKHIDDVEENPQEEQKEATLETYILLDSMIANCINEPTKTTQEALRELKDSVTGIPEDVEILIDAVLEGEYPLPEDGIDQIISELGDYPSLLSTLNAGEGSKSSEEEDDFEVPEEEEFTEEDEEFVNDSVKDAFKRMLQNKSLSEVTDSVVTIEQELLGKNKNYDKIKDSIVKAISSNSGEFFKVVDNDVLDKLLKGETRDDEGNILNDDIEEKSVVDLFTEALNTYAEGDSSKLEALTKKSIQVEEGEQAELEDREDPEDEDIPEDEEFDGDEEHLEDSIRTLAKRILKGKSVNKLVDSLKDHLPVLDSYDLSTPLVAGPYFKEQDCSGVVVSMPPMEYKEYCAVCPPTMTPAMKAVIEGLDCKTLPPIEEYAIEGNCIVVNNGPLRMPYKCSIEELEEKLSQAEGREDLHKIISSETAPIGNVFKAAVLCDNLPYIDNRFYKKNLLDKKWYFDSEEGIPECLEGIPDNATSLEVCDESEANYHLCGMPFRVR